MKVVTVAPLYLLTTETTLAVLVAGRVIVWLDWYAVEVREAICVAPLLTVKYNSQVEALEVTLSVTPKALTLLVVAVRVYGARMIVKEPEVTGVPALLYP